MHASCMQDGQRVFNRSMLLEVTLSHRTFLPFSSHMLSVLEILILETALNLLALSAHSHFTCELSLYMYIFFTAINISTLLLPIYLTTELFDSSVIFLVSVTIRCFTLTSFSLAMLLLGKYGESIFLFSGFFLVCFSKFVHIVRSTHNFYLFYEPMNTDAISVILDCSFCSCCFV